MPINRRTAPRNDEFNALLDTNGDGTGNSLAVGDFFTTPTTFFFECPAGSRVHINRMLVHIRDMGPMKGDSYGAVPGLAPGTGVLLRIRDADTIVRVDALSGLEICSNAHWARVCYDAKIVDFGPGGDGFVQVRWTFSRDHRHGLILTAGDRIEVLCRGDLSGLIDHRFSIRGDIYVED